MFIQYGEYWEKMQIRIAKNDGGTPSILRGFDFQSVSRDENFNAKFARFQGPRRGGKQFSVGNARRAPDPSSTGRRPEDRSARPIEGQVANYVQLQSAEPMKIEREFANTVGGADPGGPGYSDADILEVSVQIRLDSGPGSSFAKEQEKAKGTARSKTSKETLNLLLLPSRKQIKL